MNSGQNSHLLAALREKLEDWSSDFSAGDGATEKRSSLISSGCEAFDHFLPQGGFLPGQLVEWLGERGSGAATLAMMMARQALVAWQSERTNQHGTVVVVDAHNDFHPPAAADWGIALSQLIVVRPALTTKQFSKNTSNRRKRSRSSQHEELIWALDQCLRCPAVSAVWSFLPQIDSRDFRRLRLAAEEGHTLGLLIRDVKVRGQPSWSDLQLFIRALPSKRVRQNQNCITQPITTRNCELKILRCRRGIAGRTLKLQIDEVTGTISQRHEQRSQTHPLPLASQLARPASDRREASA